VTATILSFVGTAWSLRSVRTRPGAPSGKKVRPGLGNWVGSLNTKTFGPPNLPNTIEFDPIRLKVAWNVVVLLRAGVEFVPID
jgi:hypothetical protein